MNSRLISRIARYGGGKLVNLAVDRLLPAKVAAKARPQAAGGRTPLGKGLASAAALRLATRSVPGAILVGGGLLAKALYDRRRARRARTETAPGDDHAG